VDKGKRIRCAECGKATDEPADTWPQAADLALKYGYEKINGRWYCTKCAMFVEVEK